MVEAGRDWANRARIVVMTSSSPYCDGMEQLIVVSVSEEIAEGGFRADFYAPEWYECTPELQGSPHEMAIDWVKELGEVILFPICE